MRLPSHAVALAFLLAGPVVLSARQPPVISARNASYVLHATLTPASRTLTGTGRLSWRNTSTLPTSELQFHLYWNAWRDHESTWMRELRRGRNPRALDRPADSPRGAIDVTRLTVASHAGPSNLVERARFLAPDDGNAEDRTVWAVPLDRPVVPGETIEIEMAWTARVPLPFARTGGLGDYFFISQWFPKIAVLQNEGWNAHQFHLATEFFADFGSYDVSLTVPAPWLVGATGREQGVSPAADGMVTHRFTQDDVHDFAWATSPRFVEVRERITEAGLPPVDVRLLLQPEHRDQASRHVAAARVALRSFGRWFGPYPYGHVTIIDPVTVMDPMAQGESTGGMEYPTLITAGTVWGSPWRVADPEEVVIHELGHQFWYGLVATNEFEHAWMDEGLTTYATARAMAEAYPGRFVAGAQYFGGLVSWPYEDVRWSLDVDGLRSNSYRLTTGWNTPQTATWRFWPATAGGTSYSRTALWLATLEQHIGWPTLQRVLAAHFSRGMFRHPTPEEFFATASEVSGQDLAWFFDAVQRSDATFDYAVGPVISAPREGTDRRIRTTVVVRRLAEGIFPVTVRMRFADGTMTDERWHGADRWRTFDYERESKLVAVEIDPERVLALDVNRVNNSWSATPHGERAADRWALRWMGWLQHVLVTYAFFV
jgi:hypothetical protein